MSPPTLFIEAGIGPHLLSNVRFSDLDLSTSLQFGRHIGAGVLFGRGGRYSLTYRFQHLSNASIKQPNPGIEFHSPGMISAGPHPGDDLIRSALRLNAMTFGLETDAFG